MSASGPQTVARNAAVPPAWVFPTPGTPIDASNAHSAPKMANNWRPVDAARARPGQHTQIEDARLPRFCDVDQLIGGEVTAIDIGVGPDWTAPSPDTPSSIDDTDQDPECTPTSGFFSSSPETHRRGIRHLLKPWFFDVLTAPPTVGPDLEMRAHLAAIFSLAAIPSLIMPARSDEVRETEHRRALPRNCQSSKGSDGRR